MKPARAMAWYAVGVFALSALVAPWVFWAVQPFGHWPFRRVFDRVILVAALLGLWPLLRAAGIRSWQELGFAREKSLWRQLPLGFAIGVLSYGLGVLWRLGSLQPGERPARLFGFLLVGAGVGLIEETFFRGGLQNVLQRQIRPWLAVAIAAGIYSVAHFLKPSGAHIPDEAVRWNSGFEYLGRVAGSSFQEPGVWRSVVSLSLVGVVLGWAFVRTRALYLSIGLHAGWVFTLKTLAWCGAGSWVDQPAIWPMLLLLWGGVHWWTRPKNS